MTLAPGLNYWTALGLIVLSFFTSLITATFSLGAIIGAVVGGRFAFLLPGRWFAAIIGLFVLVTTWLPIPGFVASSRLVQFVGGAVVSVVGMVAAGLAGTVAGSRSDCLMPPSHATEVTVRNGLRGAAF